MFFNSIFRSDFDPSEIEAIIAELNREFEDTTSTEVQRLLPNGGDDLLEDIFNVPSTSQEPQSPPLTYNFLKEIVSEKTVVFKKMSPKARLPTRGTPFSAGLDLYTTATFKLAPKKRVKVPTGVGIHLEKDEYALILDKSSIALKLGLKVIGGVIDSDYQGQIFVCFYNSSSSHHIVIKGTAIAQIIIHKYERKTPIWGEVEEVKSERSDAGFGSTADLRIHCPPNATKEWFEAKEM